MALVLVPVRVVRSAEVSASEKAQARAHHEQGTRLYKVNEFRAAYEQYKKAFLLFPDPALLFNMGQCLRQLGELDEAIKLYRNFLHDNPGAPNRAQLERQIADLQAALNTSGTGQLRAAAPSMTRPATVPPSETPAQDQAPEDAAAGSAPRSPGLTAAVPAAGAPVTVLAQRPEPESSHAEGTPSTSVWRKWWLWTAVVGVVAIGLGTAAAAGAFTSYKDAPCQPGWTCP